MLGIHAFTKQLQIYTESYVIIEMDSGHLVTSKCSYRKKNHPILANLCDIYDVCGK